MPYVCRFLSALALQTKNYRSFWYFTVFKSMTNTRLTVFIGMIVAAALSRILPHPPNFAPISAIALFAGAYIADKKYLALAVPLLAMLLSDAVLEMMTGWGFYSGMWVIYLCMALVTILGFRLAEHRSSVRIASFSLLASVMFFIITNLAVWASSGMYPHTTLGLQACFVAAIPFFQNSLAGDAFYAVVLFGTAALAERFAPALRRA
jgi:hypothetical protein